MSTISHGMDLAAVEELGRLLQAKSDQLRHLVTEVEGVLGRTLWQGADATAFTQQWWPEHRTRLQGAADRIHGFGQSALNNASEQRSASEVGGSVGPAAAPPTRLGHTAPAGHTSQVASGVGSVGATVGSLAQARSWQDVQRAYESADMGYYRAGGESSYQCTAWANFRWRELGYDGFVSGNGWQMANLAPGEVSPTPTLGALASTTERYNHVMVVEEISTSASGDLRIRVSEMNTGRDGSGWQQGNPEEYSDQDWLVRRGDSWVRERSGRAYGPLTFAPFPG